MLRKGSPPSPALQGRAWRALLLAIVLLLGAFGARAQEAVPLLGLGPLWGLGAPELTRRLGDRIERLPGRFDFGPKLYADHRLRGVDVGGEPFSAYLQMDQRTGRLQQVLLERRQAQVTPNSVGRALDGLVAALGDPESERVGADPRLPTSASLVWRRGGTTVQVGLFDFQTTEILSISPFAEGQNPQVPLYRRMRNDPRFLPRRLTIRLFPSDRRDLELPAPTRPQK